MLDIVFLAQSVKGMLAARLALLDGAGKAISKLAAVVGEQFDDLEGAGLDDFG